MDATILRIIDGDTYDAEVRVWHDITVHERIRLHAWDTPESRGQCDRERMLARQATEYARRWIAEHAMRVDVEARGVDAFGRIVADVYGGGESLGAALAEAGLARPWERGRAEGWCDE